MRSLLLLLCSSLLTMATCVNGQFYADCPDDINYVRGSAFEGNLDALLSSLPAAAAASSGFAKNTTGAAPDQVYGLAQCRADVDAVDCRACLDSSVQKMAGKCAGKKRAILLYDACLLRHADESFFGAVDTSLWFVVNYPQTSAQPELLRSRLRALMSSLTAKAAYESPRMFAAGAVELTRVVNIYGMVQCTRDLAGDDCSRCLATAVAYIPQCCDGKEAGQVVYRSCSIRFDVTPFYNVQAVEVAMSPVPAQGGGPINGRDHSVAGSDGTNHWVRTALLASIPIAATLLLLLLGATAYLCMRNRKQHKHVKVAFAKQGNEVDMRSSDPLLYDLSTLRAATDNFSKNNKLGEGGFGPVYKGTLPNGQEIAVKRLSATSQQGQLEMKNEIVLVAKLQHRNLVRLLGCCIDKDEMILVYEFLPSKSLDKIIFDPTRQQELNWGQRFKIIEGIGRGLLYLHRDSRLTIIHRDLKASNVLLDADLNPKISDFGLAKLFNKASSVANTNCIAGTYGYMAPEYALHGVFSAKSDVFSFGVLVIEIVTGRRNAVAQDSGPSEDYDDLLTLVWRHWSSGTVAQLLDGYPAEGRRPDEMLRCVHVGLLCVQEDPQLRPGMASVVVMLNSRSTMLPAPTAPALASTGRAVTITAGELGGSTGREPMAIAWEQSNG
ncbi:hypothetical protein ACP70R_039707 [Stipagrostis hirtigluma subsp. patula]